MNDTILLITVVTFLVAIIAGGIFLFVKFKMKPTTLINGIDKTKTVFNFVKIYLKNTSLDENKVEDITDIIMYTLEFIEDIASDKTKENKINDGLDYIKELIKDYDINLNKDEEYIVKTILTLAYNIYESIDEK